MIPFQENAWRDKRAVERTERRRYKRIDRPYSTESFQLPPRVEKSENLE